MADTTNPTAQSTKASLGQLETTLNEYFGKKAPALPANIKEIIVKFAPYLSIIGIVIAIPALLAIFGASAFLTAVPYAGVAMAGLGYRYYVGLAFLVVTVILEALAIPGLFAKSLKGWKFIYYSVLVGALSSLVQLQLVSFVLGIAIGLYFVFQVREYYK